MIDIPIGISDFSEIRTGGYYYVDKSAFIRELLRTKASKATLITRPRRFGKTLNMSMLFAFFDIRQDSQGLFKGLEVSADEALCDEWMNQWPAVFVSFKGVEGLNFEEAYSMLKAALSKLFRQHRYLMDDPKMDYFDLQTYKRIAEKSASSEEVKNSLETLTHMLEAHYQKRVILLIDEYDVPLAKANDTGYYSEMLSVIRGMMGQSLKDNSSLEMAVITGCLRIAKESIFTGVNNFVSDTISGERYNEYFGFVPEEVETLLKDTHLENFADSIREWYDGYHFGSIDVYCPWDVMNHVNALLINSDTPPHDYWKNTSDNAIIRSFIDRSDIDVTDKFETLLSGGYITEHITENLTYDILHSSESNLWSILYLTGYLTRRPEADLPPEVRLSDREAALQIPNEEIKNIFRETILIWFQDKVRDMDRSRLFTAMWGNDTGTMTEEISQLLLQTISYYDYKEDFYHAFLAGIFTGAGYSVDSNKEYGEGRSDIVVKNIRNSRAAVFEIKHSRKLNSLKDDCITALNQIDTRKYHKKFEGEYRLVLCYGISFYKKECMVLGKQ